TPILLRRHNIKKGDVFIIISNSGRNPAGIDAAIHAKKAGAKVIIITALAAHKATKSRHSSGKMLRDFGDIVIDNCVCKQETALKLDGKDIAPVSTIAGAAIINYIMYNAARLLAEEDFPTPLYLSSNDGGDENNAKLAARYGGRVVFLS
ncbi:MAG: sugar isomerase domain-containing protein, partial [Elusimicrobiota bacterium]|nr:sugar isomerase domain-containing protein [Elusimicrobiota bacterium]